MAKLDAYTRNVYSKKLFQLQLTYDALQAIFENCCSYMDFYEALQDRGIDRKTAKYFACQFGSMGLKNQGTEPYCNLPKSTVTGGLDYSLDNVDQLLAKKESKRPPNVPPLPSVDSAMVCESSECWDDELDESRSFTFTIPKTAVPLSHTVDDFVSPSKQSNISKQIRKNSNPSKQNATNYQKSKPVREIENLNNGSKLGDLTETKNTAKSNTRTDVSKKKQDPAVFKNGTSSLQIGKFPNKKEGYQLEKELLNPVEKVSEENNSQKNEVGKQGKVVNETSPRNIESLRNEEKPNWKDTSDKYETKQRKFPRKFIGRMKTNSRNNKNSHPRKQSISSAQGNAGVATMKSNNKQSEESCEDTAAKKHDAVPLPERSALKEPEVESSQKNSNESLNGSLGVSAYRNGRSFAAVVGSSGKSNNGKILNEEASIIYPKGNKLISVSAPIEASKPSAVKNKPTSKRQQRKQNMVKDNPSGLKKEISSRCVNTKKSVVQALPDTEFKTSNGGEDPARMTQDVLKEDLNEDKTMSNSESLQTSLEPKETSASQLNYDLNNSPSVSQQKSVGTIDVANKLVTLGETDDNTDERNSVLLKQDMVIREQKQEAAVMLVEKQAEENTNKTREKNISQQDKTVAQAGEKMKTEIIQEGNIGHPEETTISVGNKKYRKTKKTKKSKQNRKPVVFVNRKSTEEKQKELPRVEIFVGDFSIHVPVDPSASVCQLQDNSVEGNLDVEPNEKPHCSSNHDSGSEKSCLSEKIVQIQDSVDNKLRVSCEEDPSGEIETQPDENKEVLDNSRIDEGIKASNVHVIIDDNSIESSNQTTLFQEQCDGNVFTKEGDSEDCDVSSTLATTPKFESTQPTSVDEFSQHAHTSHEIAMNTTVRTTDSSQQTEFDMDWYNKKEAKKLVDQEQQTDCALLSTFNIETSLIQMQDKETLTDRSVSRRAQSTDTISSSADNLSDSYGSSPSSPLYPCDIDPHDIDPHYDIDTEVVNRREHESPVKVFDISMSSHHEDRYQEEDAFYPEKDTQYPEGNTRYPTEFTQYEIPSPVENYEDSEFRYTRKHDPIRKADVYRNPSVFPERFPTHSCPFVPPPIYPSHVRATPLFHQRFPQQYFQQLPRNTSDILPHQYGGPFKF